MVHVIKTTSFTIVKMIKLQYLVIKFESNISTLYELQTLTYIVY